MNHNEAPLPRQGPYAKYIKAVTTTILPALTNSPWRVFLTLQRIQPELVHDGIIVNELNEPVEKVSSIDLFWAFITKESPLRIFSGVMFIIVSQILFNFVGLYIASFANTFDFSFEAEDTNQFLKMIVLYAGIDIFGWCFGKILSTGAIFELVDFKGGKLIVVNNSLSNWIYNKDSKGTDKLSRKKKSKKRSNGKSIGTRQRFSTWRLLQCMFSSQFYRVAAANLFFILETYFTHAASAFVNVYILRKLDEGWFYYIMYILMPTIIESLAWPLGTIALRILVGKRFKKGEILKTIKRICRDQPLSNFSGLGFHLTLQIGRLLFKKLGANLGKIKQAQEQHQQQQHMF
ncbi:hypothetical protein DAMA08_044210 [Martiniozyma asiatica (nom. inval.)]|nr:hypothetical protein DAMA08_044210 [Martiniozyma asiatica]